MDQDERRSVSCYPNKQWRCHLWAAHRQIAKSFNRHGIVTFFMMHQRNIPVRSIVKLRMLIRALPPLILLAAIASAGCWQGRSAVGRDYETAAVKRQDIEIVVSATGVVQPVRIIEVKSKGSGEIVELPVESGDYVRAGSVLARLYPRDAQNQYAQANAEVEAARAGLATAESEFKRATSLRDAQLLPETDFETKRLEVINARAQLIRAQTQLDIAAERLRETTVVAPVSGRIIEKGVELGNVVSSAVSQVSGGTTLMKMADLREVEIRALVDETDIGRVHAGQEVRIRVDAFPGQIFRGSILKIEPQAVVDQNVTMFPVLVRIPNEQEILRPGMNAEVDIFIARYEDVLALPNEAIKTPRDAVTAAAAVGLSAEEVRASLGSEGPSGGVPGGNDAQTARANTGTAAPQPGSGQPGQRRGGAMRPQGQAAPAQTAGGESRRSGGPASFGVVFKLQDNKPVPARVALGVSNWDFTQVLGGLKENDTVIILPSSTLLRQQEEFRNRMRGVSGVPGMGGGGRGPR
jgi:HlyD family secretion protein